MHVEQGQQTQSHHGYEMVEMVWHQEEAESHLGDFVCQIPQMRRISMVAWYVDENRHVWYQVQAPEMEMIEMD